MSATINLEKKHFPVLLDEIIKIISPRYSGTFLDCTFGQGGYTEKILENTQNKVITLDRNINAIKLSEKFKKKFKDRFEFYNKKFSEIDDIKKTENIRGIIFDLGFSYYQIKDPSKGLSFNHKGKLNMKMGLNEFSAQDIIKKLSINELEKIFKYFGEEKDSKLISRKIVNQRKDKCLLTEDLVNIINTTKKNFSKKNKSTKVFQALRIIVNNEISELLTGLSKSCNLISKNGKIITVTFHSIEDRICKSFFNSISSTNKVSRYLPLKNLSSVSFNVVNRKALTPSSEEIEKNPPSRSAKLRAVKELMIMSLIQNLFLKNLNIF